MRDPELVCVRTKVVLAKIISEVLISTKMLNLYGKVMSKI